QQRVMLRQFAAALVAVAAALAALLFDENLSAGFIAIGGALVGSALLLPSLLALLLHLAEHRAHAPLWRWFWADSRQQLSALSLALMALLIALATNVGVGTMVEGFRQTFVSWIDERLVAEAYFEAASAQDAAPIVAWLKDRKEVTAILPSWRAQTKIASSPVEVFGLRPHETYRAHFPLLDAEPDAWDRLARGDGVMLSEQLARRLRLKVGSIFEIVAPAGPWRAEVVGVYPDYGNPKGQMRVDLDALIRHWPDALRTNYALRLRAPEDAGTLLRELQAEFGPKISRAIDQAGVKEISIGVFERTFAVTAALNTLTLFVSGVALLATLMALGNLRLAQLAPVWALGVPRRRLAMLELLRVPLLALATAVFALPLGLIMAWLLVTVVNVEAFGWRVPFHVFPEQWALVLALALVTALAAAAIPLLRLARTAPAQLLKVFADER
ncbi:MAG TPA: ABC transporter permease, partial [Methylocystis sp.]|nr:ABC transporter permease [Methylocystis sp.]